jgi:hypothetical protein
MANSSGVVASGITKAAAFQRWQKLCYINPKESGVAAMPDKGEPIKKASVLNEGRSVKSGPMANDSAPKGSGSAPSKPGNATSKKGK